MTRQACRRLLQVYPKAAAPPSASAAPHASRDGRRPRAYHPDVHYVASERARGGEIRDKESRKSEIRDKESRKSEIRDEESRKSEIRDEESQYVGLEAHVDCWLLA